MFPFIYLPTPKDYVPPVPTRKEKFESLLLDVAWYAIAISFTLGVVNLIIWCSIELWKC